MNGKIDRTTKWKLISHFKTKGRKSKNIRAILWEGSKVLEDFGPMTFRFRGGGNWEVSALTSGWLVVGLLAMSITCLSSWMLRVVYKALYYSLLS